MNKESWPAWYFGPGGQSAIFQRAEEVPEGWQDSPAAFDARDDALAPAAGGAEADRRHVMLANITAFLMDQGERRILSTESDGPARDTDAVVIAYIERLEADLEAEQGDATRAADLIGGFQREREKLVAGMAELGIPADAGAEDATPVDKVLLVLAGVLADRARLEGVNAELTAAGDAMDGDGDGKPGGLRGERRDIMAKLKAAGITFSPTLSTDALRALLPPAD